MKLLACHNRYQLHSGEDTAFDAAVALWRGEGHDVRTLSDGERLRFIVGLAAAVANAEEPGWRFLPLDRFECVSAGFRQDVLGQILALQADGVLHQALICGCPDDVEIKTGGLWDNLKVIQL